MGYLDDPHVLPCVGNDPFHDMNNGELSVALEGKHFLLYISYLFGLCQTHCIRLRQLLILHFNVRKL